MDITEAVYDRLMGYANLTALLASYNGSPAIFTNDTAPHDAARPYVIAPGNISEIPFDALNATGQRVTRDVRAYAENTGSALAIEAIARQVRQALHRAPLSATGGQVVRTLVIGGGVAPTDDTLVGRFITVEIVTRED